MKHLVFLTGAGMSVESGFKTFRGSDGLWENYPVEQIATHEGWERDPELVTNFYNMLRKKLWTAVPNEGHRLIASLQNDHEVTVITQNVDNLHGSLLRPFIVFFGESVPMIEPAIAETQRADLFIVIGTSLNVYPAAGLLHYCSPQTPIVLIDPNPVNTAHDRPITTLKMGASEGMRTLIAQHLTQLLA